MITLLIKLAVAALSVFLVGQYFPGIHVPDYKVALVVALALGVLNVTLRPILKLITFPITLITLGLFTLVVNGFVLWLIPFIVKGFTIDGFWWAVFGAIAISFITSALDRILLGSDGKFGNTESN